MININFLKPSKNKFALAFILLIFLSYLATKTAEINNIITPTDLFCNSIENELNINTLNTIDEKTKNSMSKEEILEVADNWIPVTLFCTYPFRIVYYYIIACLIIFTILKIKKRRNE